MSVAGTPAHLFCALPQVLKLLNAARARSATPANTPLLGGTCNLPISCTAMTGEPKTRQKPIWLLVVPLLLFIAKDITATIIVLSYEPEITEKAVTNYSLELLPGSLFVANYYAPAGNLGFGVVIGSVLYLVARYRSRH